MPSSSPAPIDRVSRCFLSSFWTNTPMMSSPTPARKRLLVGSTVRHARNPRGSASGSRRGSTPVRSSTLSCLSTLAFHAVYGWLHDTLHNASVSVWQHVTCGQRSRVTPRPAALACGRRRAMGGRGERPRVPSCQRSRLTACPKYSGVRDLVIARPKYSGCRFIPPHKIFRLMVLGYCYAVRHE